MRSIRVRSASLALMPSFPDDEIDRGRVAEALEAARLGEFVAGLSKGMDTHVGECGCRLSAAAVIHPSV